MAGLALAALLSATAQADDAAVSPLQCDSGSVSILVGGAGLRQDSSPCRGFGSARAPAPGPSASRRGATLLPVRAATAPGERVDALTQRQRDSDRRSILEAELASETAQLQRLQQAGGGDTNAALGRSRANVQALQRELALLPRSPGS